MNSFGCAKSRKLLRSRKVTTPIFSRNGGNIPVLGRAKSQHISFGSQWSQHKSPTSTRDLLNNLSLSFFCSILLTKYCSSHSCIRSNVALFSVRLFRHTLRGLGMQATLFFCFAPFRNISILSRNGPNLPILIGSGFGFVFDQKSYF